MTELLKLVLPVACIAGSTWLVYDGQAQYAQAQKTHELSQESLNKTRKAFEGYDRAGARKLIISERESTVEEARFLTGLRKHASTNGATVLKWSSTAEPFTEDKDLQGLKRISTHVSAVGTYPQLYNFLQSLTNSSRFYTFSDIRWTRETSRNHVSFTLTRFVEPSENSSQ
jgi:hypothetical protein